MSKKEPLFRNIQSLTFKQDQIPNAGPECIFCLLESFFFQPTLNAFSFFSGRKYINLKSLSKVGGVFLFLFFFLTHLQMFA